MEELFKSEVVYKSARLCVGLNMPVGTFKKDFVFVTFDGSPGGFSTTGFGTEFLAKNGYVSLHVTCKRNTRYQQVTSKELVYALTGHIENKNVFLYGSSGGGYAALYFSSDVRGTAIAFSPLCSSDPVFEGAFQSGSDQPFLHTPLNEKDNSDSLGQFVIYDPLVKNDGLYFNERINRAFPTVHVYSVPGGQHSVAKTLLNNGCLKDFFFSIVNDFCFPEGVEIDPLKNPVASGKKSLNLIREGDADSAYKIIKEYGKYGVSRYGESALRKLFFDHGYSFTAEEIALTKHRKNLRFRGDEVKKSLPEAAFKDVCFFQDLAKVFISVFDFHAARSVCLLGLAYYPADKKIKGLLDEVEGFILRIENSSHSFKSKSDNEDAKQNEIDALHLAVGDLDKVVCKKARDKKGLISLKNTVYEQGFLPVVSHAFTRSFSRLFYGSFKINFMADKLLVGFMQKHEINTKPGAKKFCDYHGLKYPETISSSITASDISVEMLDDAVCIKKVDGGGGVNVFGLMKKNMGYLDVFSGREFESFSLVKEFLKEIFNKKELEIERLLLFPDGKPAIDIKFFTFYGDCPLILQIDRWGETKKNYFFDCDGRIVKPHNDASTDQGGIAGNPLFSRECLEFVKTVSKLIPAPFCRIDFLYSGEGMYVGEFTFNVGGPGKFNNAWDKLLGSAYSSAKVRLYKDLMKSSDFVFFDS